MASKYEEASGARGEAPRENGDNPPPPVRPPRVPGWQLPKDMVEEVVDVEEADEAEEYSDPTADLREGVGDTERLEAVDVVDEEMAGNRPAQFVFDL